MSSLANGATVAAPFLSGVQIAETLARPLRSACLSGGVIITQKNQIECLKGCIGLLVSNLQKEQYVELGQIIVQVNFLHDFIHETLPDEAANSEQLLLTTTERNPKALIQAINAMVILLKSPGPNRSAPMASSELTPPTPKQTKKSSLARVGVSNIYRSAIKTLRRSIVSPVNIPMIERTAPVVVALSDTTTNATSEPTATTAPVVNAASRNISALDKIRYATYEKQRYIDVQTILQQVVDVLAEELTQARARKLERCIYLTLLDNGRNFKHICQNKDTISVSVNQF